MLTALGLYIGVYSFPMNHGGNGLLSIGGNQDTTAGCIGDCSACHSLTEVEAYAILKDKFDVKEILSISIKRGYFEIKYKTNKNKEEKINLLFSKDKACKEIIPLK
ncbi:MAG: hypothetical protein GXO45_00530 [Aquificae bacterium]|nr:hypothetical protein [Aquificota bacterium]